MAIFEGQSVPRFEASDEMGKLHKPSLYDGRWLLIYFYPTDDTPGCTKQACAIRDAWSEFGEAGISVLGVSGNSAESHVRFKEKHTLPFPLLVDKDGDLKQKFEVTGRDSFLVNPEGKIAKIYRKVEPELHAQSVLSDVKGLGGKAACLC